MRNFICLLIVVSLTNSCKPQSTNDIITNTTQKIIQSIKDSDYTDFRNFIGIDLYAMAKDENTVAGEFKQLHYYYNYYLKYPKPANATDNILNNLGQKKVTVIFFDGADTLKNIKRFGIELFFGPPTIVPLNKISGYAIVLERNSELNIIAPPKLH